MSVDTVDVLLEEATAFIAVADSGDAASSALEQAAIRIEQAMRLQPGLTLQDVGKRVGKSHSYVGRLLKALVRARTEKVKFVVDWQRGKHGTDAELQATEPEKLIQVLHQKIAEAPPKERKTLTRAVTDTSTVGGRHIENTVLEKIEKKIKPRPEPPTTGIPLSVAWSGILLEIDKWARGLQRFDDEMIDELVEANPAGAERIAATVERLETQVQRLLRGLRGRDIELDEGNVIDMPARTNTPPDLVDVVADRL